MWTLSEVARLLCYVGNFAFLNFFFFSLLFSRTESNFLSTVLILFTDHDNTFKLEALIRFMVVLSCYGCYEKSLFCTLFSIPVTVLLEMYQ